MAIVQGAIADDFTGATDLCNTLVQEGMRTVQVIGAPNAYTDPGGAETVVVALRSRTAPADLAIVQSLAAYGWLIAQGAKQVIEKCCSTFDSTPQANQVSFRSSIRPSMPLRPVSGTTSPSRRDCRSAPP